MWRKISQAVIALVLVVGLFNAGMVYEAYKISYVKAINCAPEGEKHAYSI